MVAAWGRAVGFGTWVSVPVAGVFSSILAISVAALAFGSSAAMALLILSGKDIGEIPLHTVSDQGDPIVKVLAEVKAGTTGPVAGADSIDEIAMASGLYKEMKIDHRLVGGRYHKSGRAGGIPAGSGLALQ